MLLRHTCLPIPPHPRICYVLANNIISCLTARIGIFVWYDEFYGYSSSNINIKYSTDELCENIKNIIDPVIEEKSKISAWLLVAQTHKELPWVKSYEEGRKNDINLEIMKRYFLKQ